ncbi:hypothetical protein ACFLXV_00075 [Chloroflexota bacterium]
MRNPRIVLATLLLLVVIISAFGCSGEETTPTPTLPSAQLSTTELSEPYLLPQGLVNSELEIYVDGTLWKRVEKLSDFGPNDKIYVVVEDSEGQSSIRFGDGEHGARLSSRSSKVVATYRLGSDADGDNGAL